MVVEHLLHLGVVHHRGDFFRELVHVAVAALQFEGRLLAVQIILRGALDVLLIDLEDHLTHLQHALQHRFDLTQLGRGIVVAQGVAGHVLAQRLVDQQIQVVETARGHRCEHGVGRHAVLDVAELEGLLHAAEHVAQVVDIGAVGQHVRDLEDLARFGVRVARHDDAEALAAQIMRLGLAAPHAFDAARAVGERDELLQKLRAGVLNVVDVQHHVVGHLERQIELFQLLGGGGIGCLRRVERAHRMAQRRAVDLHEDQAQTARHVFHQRGLAVARWRDHHQQTHLVGALGLAHGADLLGQVVPDHRQITLVDELVAHKRGQRACLELLHANARAVVLEHLLAQLLVACQLGHEGLEMACRAQAQIVDLQRHIAAHHTRMLAQQTMDLRAQIDAADLVGYVVSAHQIRRRLTAIRQPRRALGRAQGLACRLQPVQRAAPALAEWRHVVAAVLVFTAPVALHVFPTVRLLRVLLHRSLQRGNGRLAVAGERKPQRLLCQLGLQIQRPVAHHAGDLVAADWVAQVTEQAMLFTELAQLLAHIGLQALELGFAAEQLHHRLRLLRAARPLCNRGRELRLLNAFVLVPEQHRQRARIGCEAQHASGVAQRQQGLQNQRGVVVVNTAFIAFAITRRGKLANRLRERRAIHQ